MGNILDEFAIKYKTDKSSELHNYTKYYNFYFNHLRSERIKVLEIGVQNGYSIQMWDDYFACADVIVGMDIDISKSKQLTNNKVKIVEGNQYDINALKNISNQYGPFDIIIDDGCHTNASMRIAFDNLFPLLKNDGFYVIEDMHCCYWPTSPDFGNHGDNFMDYIKTLVDDVNNRGKFPLADRDKTYSTVGCEHKTLDGLEQSVDSIFIHKSICFIKKHIIQKGN